MSKIAVIKTSPHNGGNSNILADEFIKGALENENEIFDINLNKYDISYCLGCYGTKSKKACTATGYCYQKDDINEICDMIRKCDVLVFATPIYFYSVCGQMKVFLDRTVQLYGGKYNYRDVYLIAASESGLEKAMDGAIKTLEGWIDCMPKTSLKGVVYGTGALAPKSIKNNINALNQAKEMGKSI